MRRRRHRGLENYIDRQRILDAALGVLANKPGRIPILVGASGVGKSSVAQAGVLSALKSMHWPGREGAGKSDWPERLRDSRSWAFLTMRPGEAPLAALAGAFIRLWQLDLTDPLQLSSRPIPCICPKSVTFRPCSEG